MCSIYKITFLLILAGMFSLFSSSADAACDYGGGTACGVATSYEVQVMQVEICTGSNGTDCQEAVVIGSGAGTFDIAGASAGAEVGRYGSAVTLEKGKIYTHIRTILSSSFGISGSITDGSLPGGNCNTGGVITVTVPPVDADFPAAFFAGFGIINNGATFTKVTALSSPVTITDTMPNIDIAFRTEEGLTAINAGGGMCLFLPELPEIKVTVK